MKIREQPPGACPHAIKLPEPPLQIPIATVYADGNGTSHYRPLADTLNTQSALVRAALGRP